MLIISILLAKLSILKSIFLLKALKIVVLAYNVVSSKCRISIALLIRRAPNLFISARCNTMSLSLSKE